MAQRAYRQQEQRRPDLKVKKGGASRLKLDLQLVRRVAVTAVMLALVCSVLFSHAQLSELTMDIQEYRAELREEEHTFNYLSGELNSKTNMKNVEEAASGELGLIKLDPAQVTYFTLDGEDQVDKPESSAQKLAGWLTAGFHSLMEHLDP